WQASWSDWISTSTTFFTFARSWTTIGHTFHPPTTVPVHEAPERPEHLRIWARRFRLTSSKRTLCDTFVDGRPTLGDLGCWLWSFTRYRQALLRRTSTARWQSPMTAHTDSRTNTSSNTMSFWPACARLVSLPTSDSKPSFHRRT